MFRRSRPPSPLALATVGVAAAAAVSAAWALEVGRRARHARRVHRLLVELLLNSLTAGDPVTARHSRRVADLSYVLACHAGMPRRHRATLRIAALLHDMGKIDDRFFQILHSREPLSREQRAEIRTHPHESAHILAPLEPIHPGIRDIVSSHHECWDGEGYPRGLRGEEIPLAARIIALADVFDAITQPRAYSEARTADEALERLRDGAGRQFDPALVEAVHHRAVRRQWSEIARRGHLAEARALQKDEARRRTLADEAAGGA